MRITSYIIAPLVILVVGLSVAAASPSSASAAMFMEDGKVTATEAKNEARELLHDSTWRQSMFRAPFKRTNGEITSVDDPLVGSTSGKLINCRRPNNKTAICSLGVNARKQGDNSNYRGVLVSVRIKLIDRNRGSVTVIDTFYFGETPAPVNF